MKRLTSAETRQAFLDYFAQHGHQVVASSSLVPGNDPSLLFTNAGMVQFKDVFLGMDHRSYSRATTSQKCMRISGKHNDLENVGPSPRHHTFFEMLGNFSFGDYFKRDAIKFAYELLTQVYGIPPDRLFYTVYRDDDEAFDVWTKDLGIAPERVHRMGPKTNFWQMADTGPCGPTSEIHYDWGKEACTCGEPDCSVALDNGCGRWLELWNLVFMQFNRTQADPAHTGKFDQKLPAPGVDTGMGLERILAVIQNAKANYDTDLFTDIMDATQEILGHDDAFRQENFVAYRVIADHTRAATFLVADGVNPGTTGREYITRMLIRRAWRFAHTMGVEEPFLSKVSETVIAKMSGVYPELEQFREAIRYQISAEEGRFVRMLDRSMKVLDNMFDQMTEAGQTTMSGEDAFFLYGSHGLPLEITRDVLKEHGLSVDEPGFEKALDEHRNEDFDNGEVAVDLETYKQLAKELDGVSRVYNPYDYDRLSVSTKVVALLVDGKRVKTAKQGQKVEIVLEATPFYVESGGQVSDTGTISMSGAEVRVDDMVRPVGGLILHVGEVTKGKLAEGDAVTATVDATRRWDIMRNHTATHLLQASLQHVLGKHVRQKGSLVAPDRLRFDFTHDHPITPDELDRVTEEVNEMILAARPVQVAQKPLDEARREGAMALFGEKYGEIVRTITIPREDGQKFSYELCGGTHVRMTSDIGPCLIVDQSSPGAGNRRIVAVTGHMAQRLIRDRLRTVTNMAGELKSTPDQVEDKVRALVGDLHDTQEKVEVLERQAALSSVDTLVGQAQDVGGVKLVAAVVQVDDPKILGEIADRCKDKLGSGVVALGAVVDGEVRLVTKVSKDLVAKGIHAGKLVGSLAGLVDGKGGGRPDFATAGGKSPAKLTEAIKKAKDFVAGAAG